MKASGVILWQGRLTYYEPGEDGLRAHFVGESQPLPVGPELRAAILADLERQASKGQEA